MTAADADKPGLGTLLKAWRKRALLTQEQLADRSGVSVRTVRKLEAGQVRRPHGQSLQRLAGALELTEQERAALSTAQQAAPAVRRLAPATPPWQLPMDVPGFTGRAEQLARLDALLADGTGTSPGTVVITAIAGTAGVGKTALAVHWAHQVRERFPDGQLYVNLHGYAPGTPLGPLAALAQMLGALGVAADGVPLQLDQAAGLYRSLLAGKRVLVVLDNARSAAQVRPLLPGSPGCLVLITSRDRLDGLVASHGADRLALDVLTPAEAVSLLGRIMGAPRVAAAAGTDDLRAQSAGHRSLAMARSCLGDYAQAADHHGSALELARQAGWADAEAASLAGLGLTYRDWGRLREAAGHLTQALARYRQTGSKLGEAVTLVNLAGVTRELGWPQRAAGHAGEALAVSREIGSQGGEIAALSTLGETDRDLGRLDDARRHLSQSLALTRELGDRYGEAHALCVLAMVHRDAGRHAKALEAARAGLALTRELREPRTQAEALTTLGSIHLRRGRPQQAIGRYRQAFDLSRQSETHYPETEALLGLAAAHHELGRHSLAAGYAQQALAVARKAGYRVLEGQAHDALAASAQHLASSRA